MEKLKERRVPISVVALLVVAWASMLVVPPAYLLARRSAWLAALEAPEAQAGWDEFRDAMRRQSGRDGPVQRKVPKSAEPPLRVWLRDHVWLAIAAWVVLGGTLGLFAVLLVIGAAARPAVAASSAPAVAASSAQDQPRCDRDHEEQHDRDAQHAEDRRHGDSAPRET